MLVRAYDPCISCSTPLLEGQVCLSVRFGARQSLTRDDGVGNAVLAELDRKYKLSPGVDLLYDCSSGDVLDAPSGGRYRKAIVVDAAELGRRPGEWMLFNLQNAVLSGIDMAHWRQPA